MDFLVAGAILTTMIPYLFYAWAYKYTDTLPKFLTQKRFIKISQFLKLLDVAFSLPILYREGINSAGACIGLPMIFIGQYLNELVYTVLGDAGVYYGLEMKVVKPRWIGGFPFTIGDPQYKGSIMTILGIYFCVQSTKEVLEITIAWMISYFFIVCVENSPSSLQRKKTK